VTTRVTSGVKDSGTDERRSTRENQKIENGRGLILVFPAKAGIQPLLRSKGEASIEAIEQSS